MKVTNRHERIVAAPPERIAALIEHWFELELAEGGTVLRHTLQGCAVGKYDAIWSERIEPFHGLIREAVVDNVEAAVAVD